MRTRTLLISAVAALFAAVLVPAAARAASKARRYRISQAGDAKSLQQLPGPFLTATRRCTVDVNPGAIPGVTLPLAPDLLGADFDPAAWQEISVAGDGGLLGFASSVSEAGAPGPPGAPTHVVLRRLGEAPETVRVTAVGAEDDQPSVRFDPYGYRCAFRSSAAAGGGAPSNIQLYSFTNQDATPLTATVAVTQLTGDLVAFAPALAARVRIRNAGSGVRVRERDARVAFVSTGDLAPAAQTVRNTDNREQLFLWSEQDKTFLQITKHTQDGAHVDRPTISMTGDVVYFESTADLDPASVDPLDPARVGNPDGVRQIYRWRHGRGIDQVTWSDGDCFSPRTDPAGRFVLFCSRGDPFHGDNADRNLEIFAWVAGARPTLRLRQLTKTTLGDNVFPRPIGRPDLFVFYSTAHPPRDPSADLVALMPQADVQPAEFGKGLASCSPQALLYDRRRVFHVHGFLDVENAARLFPTRSAAQQTPIVTGPPAPGTDASSIFFATNDYRFNPVGADGSRPEDATLAALRIARARRR